MAPVATLRPAGRRRKVLLMVIAVVVAVAVVAVAVSSASGSAPTVRLAPFSLPRLGPTGANAADPVDYPLSRSERERPVVLAFFASWCVLCRSDLPVVAAVASAERRSGDAVEFIGIDGNDPPADGWAFAKSAHVHFAVASDQQEAVARQIGLDGLPDTVLVAPSGHVVRIMAGLVTAKKLEAAIAQLSPRHAVLAGAFHGSS